MEVIRLTKDGFIKRTEHGDEKVEFDIGFFQYWRSTLKIEGTVTLSDLVSIINSDALLFLEMLTQCSISEFMKEMHDDVENDYKLDSIKIGKYYEANEYDDFNSINEVVKCSGRYKKPIVSEYDPNHVDELCAIELCHWGTLKDLPLVLDLNATLTINFDYKKVKTYEANITVGDFFNGLFDEICFFGSPRRRDGKIVELERCIKEIENGTAELISWEEFKEKLKIKKE